MPNGSTEEVEEFLWLGSAVSITTGGKMFTSD